MAALGTPASGCGDSVVPISETLVVHVANAADTSPRYLTSPTSDHKLFIICAGLTQILVSR